MQFDQRRLGLFIIPFILGLISQTTLAASSQYAVNGSALNWTGFYAGLNAGYNFSSSNNVNVVTDINALSALTDSGEASASADAGRGSFLLNNNGVSGGGQVGYNWNFLNNFVTGFEADIQGIAGGSQSKSLSQSVADVSFPDYSVFSDITVSKSINYLGTIRNQLGYLVTPTLLVSVTGGLAYAGVKLKTSINQSLVPPVSALTPSWGTARNYSNTLFGWTVGGNIEWMLHSNWSVKVEYLYYNLGNATYSSGELVEIFLDGGADPGKPAFTNGVNTATHFKNQVVHVGVNYHFC